MTEVITLVILLMLYFLPTFCAESRNHKNMGAIFLFNLSLGWTGFGWIGALIWSFTNE